MVDREKLMERMGSLSLLSRLTSKLAEKIPEHLVALRACLADDDASGLAQEAHRLKGAVANFESAEVTEAARALEETARSGDLDLAATQVEPLLKSLEQLLAELEAMTREC